MLSLFLALAAAAPPQTVDVHERQQLLLFVRVIPGVKPAVGSLELVDALDRAFRSATMLRVAEVGQECGAELACLAKQGAAGATRFGIAVFSGTRGNDVVLLDLAVVRELLSSGSQDLLADMLRRAVLVSADQGTFDRSDEVDRDASRFLEQAREKLTEAGLWGRAATARVVFLGAHPSWLHVNGSTVAVAPGTGEVVVSGLWPRHALISASTPWATAEQRVALEAGAEPTLSLELPRGPGIATRNWLIGGGSVAMAAGTAMLIAVGVANASAKRVPCLQVAGGPNEACTPVDVAVPIGAGIAGLGVGAISAAIAGRDEASAGLDLADGFLLVLGAALGATPAIIFEVTQ